MPPLATAMDRCIDASDAPALAEFWVLDDVPDSPFQSLAFGTVPEPKTTKNRIHIDVTTDDLPALLAAGAHQLRAKGDDGLERHVLQDPAGNESCAFTRD